MARSVQLSDHARQIGFLEHASAMDSCTDCAAFALNCGLKSSCMSTAKPRSTAPLPAVRTMRRRAQTQCGAQSENKL